MTTKHKTAKLVEGPNAVDRLIVFHSKIHAAFILAEKNHRCAIDDALDYIDRLESNPKQIAKKLLDAADSTDYHNCHAPYTSCYDKEKVRAVIESLGFDSITGEKLDAAQGREG